MRADTLTLGSLFSGIGGLELGLEMTGRFKTVWQVEQNEYCRKVLARHWPDATRFEDVRNVGRENLAPVDVICGGFPCQDISNAGKKVGIGGERSGLWYEYARIVRELRPSFVVVENVRALLIRGIDAVLGSLAEIGYDAEWQVLSAASVGAPHLRERLFIVAYASELFGDGGEHHAGSNRQGTHAVSQSGNCRSDAYMADSKRGRQSGSGKYEYPGHSAADSQGKTGHAFDVGWWSVEPAVGRVAHGVPNGMERLTALGNAVVPQCARVIGERLLEIHDSLTQEGAAESLKVPMVEPHLYPEPVL